MDIYLKDFLYNVYIFKQSYGGIDMNGTYINCITSEVLNFALMKPTSPARC